MKKGFTLAEVLITLAIIGVVATLTLPALMTNTAEQQAKTALKKGVSLLTDAAHMNATSKGFDYGAITSSNTQSEDEPSLWALFSTQLAVDMDQSGAGKQRSAAEATGNFTSANYTFFLRDGSSITFKPADNMKDSTTVAKIDADGLPHGIPIIFDTNGNKGPNVLSNCEGKAYNAKSESSSGDCSKKGNRVFKDQYALRLRNSIVVPNGAAARYIYGN